MLEGAKTTPQRNTDLLLAALLLVITAASRLMFIPDVVVGSSFDSGNYALAVRAFDLTATRPHLPGYFLYVQAIRLLEPLAGEPLRAMVWLAVAFSALGAALGYRLLRRWFKRETSFWISAILLTHPLVWYYGCVPEIYAFDLFFSVLVILIGLSPRAIYFLPFVMGFLAGVRPSSGVLLFPVYLYLWYRQFKSPSFSGRKFWLAHLAGLVGLLLWLVPLVQSAGGFSQYLNLYRTNNPMESLTLLQNWFRFSAFAVFLALPYLLTGLFLLPVFFRKKERSFFSFSTPEADCLPLLLWWLLPPLFFFLFVHYSKGYFLICALPFFALPGLVSLPRSLKRFLFSAIVGIQTLVFVAAPYVTPDIQVYFAPRVRTLSLPQVWWQRLRSVYLPSRSHLQATQENYRLFSQSLRRLEQNAFVADRNENFLFLDPTFPLNVRSLQAKFPQYRFTTMSYTRQNLYLCYRGIEQEICSDFAGMLARAYIFSRSDFVNRYLADIPKRVQIAGKITVFTVGDSAAAALADRYREFFRRGKP